MTRPESRAGLLCLACFSGFGLVWGMYAAALPAIKSATAASDAALGLALTSIGFAALPAMAITGRLLDRYGRVVLVGSVCGFAITALLPALVGSVPALVVALLTFGVWSGAYDVSMNVTTLAVELRDGRRLLNKAHAVFSLSLLGGSLGTGFARDAGVPVEAVLATATVVLLGVAAAAARGGPGPAGARTGGAEAGGAEAGGVRAGGVEAGGVGAGGVRHARSYVPLIAVAGGLAALALVVENGLQQWSSVFVEDVLHSTPAVGGLAPALLAGAAALGRLTGHGVQDRLGDITLLVLSGSLAAPGALIVATAGPPAMALAGLALAGAGVSVAAPTLYGLAGRLVGPDERGRAVAAVSSVAYVGLLGGPGLVGLVAGLSGLRVGIGVLAIAALVVACGAPALRHWTHAGARAVAAVS